MDPELRKGDFGVENCGLVVPLGVEVFMLAPSSAMSSPVSVRMDVRTVFIPAKRANTACLMDLLLCMPLPVFSFLASDKIVLPRSIATGDSSTWYRRDFIQQHAAIREKNFKYCH